MKTFIDLFAGCGGISLGLEMAGFTSILYNEINPSAAMTYIKNRDPQKPLPIILPDATKLTPDYVTMLKSQWKVQGIHDVDLVVGGPPCWGYSKIGLCRTFNTEKNNIGTNYLFKTMAAIIKEIHPKIFLFENVKGLLTSRWTFNGKKGEIWEDVKSSFQNIDGYEIQSELIHCYDYGISQNRPRIILIGVRTDIGVKVNSTLTCGGFLPEPSPGMYPSIQELLGDLVDPNYKNKKSTDAYPTKPLNDIQSELRKSNGKVAAKGAKVYNHQYSQHTKDIIHKFQYMLDNNGEIPEAMVTKKFVQRVLPKSWNNKNPNITVTSLPDDYVHYSQPRTLTVREWARLQTFPDRYVFYGPRTTGGRRRTGEPKNNYILREIPQYTQIGNAVPVKMAKLFGLHFKKIIG